MAQQPHEKKFEAVIPLDLWRAFEAWAKNRTKMTNPQIAEALFRLFLAAPEWMKLLAFVANWDQLANLSPNAWREMLEAAPEKKLPQSEGEVSLEKLRDVVACMNIHTRLLSAEEQEIVDDIRRRLGPDQNEQRNRKTS
jgi:hypothetical protein